MTAGIRNTNFEKPKYVAATSGLPTALKYEYRGYYEKHGVEKGKEIAGDDLRHALFVRVDGYVDVTGSYTLVDLSLCEPRLRRGFNARNGSFLLYFTHDKPLFRN